MLEGLPSITIEEYKRDYLAPAVEEMCRRLGPYDPNAEWLKLPQETRDAIAAKVAVWDAWWKSPGYFWLGQYAEDTERLWPFECD